MDRPTALLALSVTVLLLSGCTSAPSGDQPPRTTVAPAQLPDSAATDRALAAETESVSSQLRNASCLDYWEIGQFTAEAEATVTNRTKHGVVVDVQRPYSWAKDGGVADAVANARYLVTENETIRRSGPSIDPC
jgi:hypothetical protein